MDTGETARLVGDLAALRNDCEILAEAAAGVGEMDRYPSATVQFLTEAAKEATDLKYRILNTLIGAAGPKVDSWRNLIAEMDFVESYRIDKDFRWLRDRPDVRSLKTVARIVADVCRHFGSETETKKKPSGRRGPSADIKWHQQVTAIAGDCQPSLDDLQDFCKRLDKIRVRVPKTWAKHDGIQTWTEALEFKDKWHIIKALNYSRQMTSKLPSR